MALTWPRWDTWRLIPTLGTLAGLWAGSASVPTPASDDPFEDLRQRIELLEQDQRQLRDAVLPDGVIPVSAESLIPPAPLENQAESEEARVARLVDEYLSQRQDLADPSRDQTLSALSNQVSGILDRLNKKTYPTVQVNGVFQADAGFFDQDANSVASYGPILNGSDFRRARLSAKGAITESTNYFMQMDFAFFGRPTFTDVWVEQTGIPGIGTIRVGQWKHPFSLEVVSSFRYTTFSERSLLFIPFTPFRHLGAGFYNHAEDLRSTWAGSVFFSGQDQFGGSLASLGGIGTAERITWLPYWDDCSNGREYVHLGLGHFFNAPPNEVIAFRTIPELYVGAHGTGNVGTSGQAAPGSFNGTPFFVNTGNLGVTSYNVLGTELLWVDGPFSLQSEGMVSFVNQADSATGVALQNVGGGPMAMLSGVYAQAGYFLTGEHRPYDRKAGAIDRVIPRRNFGPTCDQGWGAWEVAGRFSYVNLSDKNIRGGRMHDYTAGVNWYLNPYWKVQFNYILSMSDFSYLDGQPATGIPATNFLANTTSIFNLRCQVDF